MVSLFFFLWFLLAALWTVNALRRPVAPGEGFPPPWLPAMIVSELAPALLLLRALIALAFVAAGATGQVVGLIGLMLFVLSEIGLVVVIGRTVVSARETGIRVTPWSLLRFWDRLPEGVDVRREVAYWDDLTLDLYSPPDAKAAPALIYVHPGSWMRGRPGRQARPMFHFLLREGWVILDIRYPLSPAATFPEHLIGVKRAIGWAKEVGVAHGIDPARIAVSGASSGAHLAALAALTWDRTDLQPDFEEADTSLAACVPFYGIYDLLVRNPTRYDWPFIARYVMKARPTDAPDLYRLGSPVDQVRGDAPPFYVVHGQFDSVVLASESRHFVEALGEVGAQVQYHEVTGAQHGFDAVASLRSRAVARMCADWLAEVVGTGQATRGR